MLMPFYLTLSPLTKSLGIYIIIIGRIRIFYYLNFYHGVIPVREFEENTFPFKGKKWFIVTCKNRDGCQPVAGAGRRFKWKLSSVVGCPADRLAVLSKIDVFVEDSSPGSG